MPLAEAVLAPERGALGTGGAVVVVAALREELAPLLKRASRISSVAAAGRRTVRARLGAIELLATATGGGPRRAGAGVQRLLDTQPVTLLIGIGIGGALDPALEVGHLVVAARTRERQGPSLAPDPAWRRRAEALGARGRSPTATR